MGESLSRKAREKQADTLLALSNTLLGAVAVALLVAPLAALVAGFKAEGDDVVSFLNALATVPPAEIAAFIALYLLAMWLGTQARKDALNTYSKLYPDED